MDEPTSAWVLYHAYGDGSGFSVVRVYLDDIRAKEDHQLMQSERGVSSTEWFLVEAPLYGDAP